MARRSATTSASGKPTTFVIEPRISVANSAAIPCTAYPPALPRHSPESTYAAISSGASSRKLTPVLTVRSAIAAPRCTR